jgi:hypothetical protein
MKTEVAVTSNCTASHLEHIIVAKSKEVKKLDHLWQNLLRKTVDQKGLF